MPTLEQTQRLVEAYAAEQARLTAALIRILLALWLGFPYWGNRDMERAWVARSAVEVDVALAQVRRVARAYMLTYLELIDARPESLPETVDSYERGGTPLTEVYQRPARQRDYVERFEREQGATDEEALERAAAEFEERLRTIVDEDVMVTARDEQEKVARASSKVIGYRRILHPEFSQTGPCGLCVVAADRIYNVGALPPMHPNCKCTVSPVTRTQDLGLQLNRDDLERIYEAAGGTDRSRLSQLRIKEVAHGELGPMLLRSGGKWVTPSEVNRRARRSAAKATPYARQTRETTRDHWRAMKETSERSIRYLEAAKARGTNLVDLGTGRPVRVNDLDAAIQYHRDLIARAARHAA